MYKDFLIRTAAIVTIIIIVNELNLSIGIGMLISYLFLIGYDYIIQRKIAKVIGKNKNRVFEFQKSYWILNLLPFLFSGYWTYELVEDINLLVINLLLLFVYSIVLYKVKRYQIYLVDNSGILKLNNDKFWSKDSIREINIEKEKISIDTSFYFNDIVLQMGRLSNSNQHNLIFQLNKLKEEQAALQSS